MRRKLKITAIVLAVLLVFAAGTYLSFRSDIDALIAAMTVSEEELQRRQVMLLERLQQEFEEKAGIDLAQIEAEVRAEQDAAQQLADVSDDELPRNPGAQTPVPGGAEQPNPQTGQHDGGDPVPGGTPGGAEPAPGGSDSPGTSGRTPQKPDNTAGGRTPQTEPPKQSAQPEQPEQPSQTGQPSPTGQSGQSGQSGQTGQNAAPSENEEVKAILKRFYEIQGTFLGQLNAIPGQAEAEFHSLPKEQWTGANKKAVIQKYVGVAGSLEQSCDKSVYNLTQELRKALKRNHMDADLANSVQQYYLDSKSQQKAQFMKEYKNLIS